MPKSNDQTLKLPVPPPFLLAIFLIVALIFGWKLLIPVASPWWIRLTGSIILLGGVFLALSAVRELLAHQCSPNPAKPVTEMVTSGPFRMTRNPIYLGFLLVLAGFPLIFGYYWGCILAPIAGDAFSRLIIVREETYLLARFNQKYFDYQAKVRRWI